MFEQSTSQRWFRVRDTHSVRRSTSLLLDSEESMSTSNPATGQSARQACYNARDAYFQCLDKKSPSCESLEAAFRTKCKPSWAKYFLQLRQGGKRILQVDTYSQSKRTGD